MLTLKQISEQPEEVIRRLAIKRFDAQKQISTVLQLDEKRKSIQRKVDDSLQLQKKKAAEIGLLIKQGNKQAAEDAKSIVATLKAECKENEQELVQIETQITDILLTIPNLPCDLVPEGTSAEDNLCVATGGQMPDLSKKKLPHWELCKEYDLIDFELGVKITGAGFPVYKGKGARLQRALINFFLDRAREAGFLEVQPPLAVNEASGYGTGQLPDKEGQMYHVGIDNLYLIPTAEVPVTNIYRDVILKESDLPIRNTAYSACFRREAGSYGKDVRGLNRLHQFDKVEIVCIEHPERSYLRLDEMVAYVQTLVEALELPWRILRLCGGDMSFTSALTYDFEVYSAAQDRWLEVSSVSNFESYQANRLKCRYKDEANKRTVLCHTLNGSALALPRIVAALLENNQTPEGIVIPQVLRPYTGFDIID
ncbi:seryl-tRNA synthetase [Porphyromonas crevioricanis]|uniref:Serine--tRNA ligase n=1 Tax=Porphyromonas crevioricanis TaxID=393921 RepID=A0A0A2FNW0_9PORP|nr:serine--tRNA ligase [Porphyromonas crevioricanis]KGN89939.1 seryl-tRNA synthetase [Porphyromonas crevioricanis]GAD07153.1 seryl-tRNA synthetase [Porphyromonas crevioricanis JCM 13913]SQH73931.1 Serine--tRNA ligase [Porphyromonas crevioricanis]